MIDLPPRSYGQLIDRLVQIKADISNEPIISTKPIISTEPTSWGTSKQFVHIALGVVLGITIVLGTTRRS